MKKTIVAPLVGGIILFLWQFLSWQAVNLHRSAQQYTPKQEQIMNHLNSLQLEEGGYILPMAPPDATMEEWNRLMDASVGKPWAKVEYHHSLSNNMALNMVRGVVINVLTVWLLCWIIGRLRTPKFSTILTAALFTGLIVFFNAPYTNYIWYEGFDIWAHFADAVVGWGLCGLWLAWYYRRNKAGDAAVPAGKRSAVMNLD